MEAKLVDLVYASLRITFWYNPQSYTYYLICKTLTLKIITDSLPIIGHGKLCF